MKVASQQLFEETYLENKELFDDLSHEELVAETMNQLSSQKVNLQNILCKVDDFHVDDQGVFHYAVLTAVDEFFQLPSAENAALLSSLLKKSLSVRVFAATHGQCYRRLVDKLKEGKKEETSHVLDLLVVILEKQPDLVSDADIDCIVEKFNTSISQASTSDVSNLKAFLAIIFNICTLHENNRQSLLAKKVPELIFECMRKCPKTFIQGCGTLRTFILDDDVRVQCGKAHEHAQHIVGHLEGIAKVVDCYNLTSKEVQCTTALLTTLGSFCVRNEYCQQVVDLGAFQIAMQSLAQEESRSNEKFIMSFLWFLKTAGGNDDVKDKIAELGLLKELVSILDWFSHSEKVCSLTFLTLSVVVLRKPQYSKLVFDHNFAQIAVSLLDKHSESVKVLDCAFLAMRTLVNRYDEGKHALIGKGVEEYLQSANSIEELRESAHLTLKVLESSKEVLSEPWTGAQGDKLAAAN